MVVPFTRLDLRVVDAFERNGIRFSPVWVGDDDEAYYRLLARLWATGADFAVVEHDVEIHAGVVPGFAACPAGWCTFPYSRSAAGPHAAWAGDRWGPGVPLLTRSLGCARFRGEITSRHPAAVVEAGEMTFGAPPRHWSRLDDFLAHRLAAAQPPVPVCIHHPEVRHHHALPVGGCSCGRCA